MQNTLMRYLTSEKLEYLIEDKGLFFSMASKQTDKEEGVYDHTIPSKILSTANIENVTDETYDKLDEIFLASQQNNRDNSFLNCWYMGEKESLDMWHGFGKDGIVIFSDIPKIAYLINNLHKSLSYSVSFGEVEYNDELKQREIHSPLYVKNSHFKDENEFRIVFDLSMYKAKYYVENDISVITNVDSDVEPDPKYMQKKEPGFILKCELDSIITEVRIHPKATERELEDLVKKLREELNLCCPIGFSQLKIG